WESSRASGRASARGTPWARRVVSRATGAGPARLTRFGGEGGAGTAIPYTRAMRHARSVLAALGLATVVAAGASALVGAWREEAPGPVGGLENWPASAREGYSLYEAALNAVPTRDSLLAFHQLM